MKVIQLTKGHVATIDDEDYEIIASVGWYAHPVGKTFYAARKTNHPENKMVYMHRQIMGNPDSDVEHKDRNGLNNQKHNLRLTSQQLNNYNRAKFSRSGRIPASRFKGVRKSSANTWRSSITVNRKAIHLGSFKTELEAAAAYDQAARSHAGDFALTNL